MKGLYKTHIFFEHGMMFGVFVAEVDEVNNLIESKTFVDFGTVYGGNTRVCGEIEPSDLTLVTTDQRLISQIEAHNLCFGVNPLNYVAKRQTSNE